MTKPMIIITGPEAQQGTLEWLQFRQEGLGASDAASIMGRSPWLTAYGLFRQKLGIDPPKRFHHYMARGQALEPKARAAYEAETGEIMVPMVAKSTIHELIRASFDGLNMNGDLHVEIKCPGPKVHAMALQGIVPDYYQDQMQHQMFVTGNDIGHYYSFDGDSGKLIELKRDQTWIDLLVEAELRFWDRIKAGTWESDEWAAAAAQWLILNREIEDLKEQESAARNILTGMLGENEKKREGGGVIVTRVARKGSIDYEAFMAAKGVVPEAGELETYRKAGSESIKITPTKDHEEFITSRALQVPAPVENIAAAIPSQIPEDFVLSV